MLDKITPRNMALLSIGLIACWMILCTFIPLAIPETNPIWAMVGLLFFFGFFGLIFAYYYYTVNIWDNECSPIKGIIFLTVPLMIITAPWNTWSSYSMAYILGQYIGFTVISTILLAVVGVKRFIKRYLLKIKTDTETDNIDPPQ